MAEAGTNYGDVRLNLPPSWERRNVFNQDFISTTIGHKAGVAEVRLKDSPEQRHAFAFVDPVMRPGHPDEVNQNRDDGYDFVREAGGWVSERFRFNAEGLVTHGGQVLMFISAEKWAELEKEREERRSLPSDPAMGLHEIAGKTDAEVESQVPLQRQQRRSARR